MTRHFLQLIIILSLTGCGFYAEGVRGTVLEPFPERSDLRPADHAYVLVTWHGGVPRIADAGSVKMGPLVLTTGSDGRFRSWPWWVPMPYIVIDTSYNILVYKPGLTVAYYSNFMNNEFPDGDVKIILAPDTDLGKRFYQLEELISDNCSNENCNDCSSPFCDALYSEVQTLPLVRREGYFDLSTRAERLQYMCKKVKGKNACSKWSRRPE